MFSLYGAYMSTFTRPILALALLAATFTPAAASPIVLLEEFEDPFENWEIRCLGENSNLTNFYVEGGSDISVRGNNPDGLWVADGVPGPTDTRIVFDAGFGATLDDFSIDIAAHVADARLEIFDVLNSVLLDAAITKTDGALVDPGIYQTFFRSAALNGIGGFRIYRTSGLPVEGNVSIDNVMTSIDFLEPVPEPGTWLLLGSGAVVLLARRVRRG
jgi:hypothetical protein